MKHYSLILAVSLTTLGTAPLAQAGRVVFWNYSASPVLIELKASCGNVNRVLAGTKDRNFPCVYDYDNVFYPVDSITAGNVTINGPAWAETWDVSYDLNANGSAYLARGKAGSSTPADPAEEFSILALSDMHCSLDPKVYPEMQAKANLVPRMADYVKSPANRVRAILMPGDLTTGSAGDNLAPGDRDLFVRRWMVPLLPSSVETAGYFLALGVGNHDFDARHWPWYPKIVTDLQDLYTRVDYPYYDVPDYFYAFDINGVHFANIGVGLYGATPDRRASGWLGTTLPEAGSNVWLKNDLAKIDARTPVIIMLHVGPAGNNFGFLCQRDIDAFKEIIQGYNVLAIIHGHTHGNANERFAGVWTFDVSGTQFLQLKINPRTQTLQAAFVAGDGSRQELTKPNDDTPTTGCKPACDY